MKDERMVLQACQHWIIKLGSAVLIRDDGLLDRPVFASVISEINALMEMGCKVTIVSSGAVALGRMRLAPNEKTGSMDLPRLQALAALGQAKLIALYDDELSNYGKRVCQVLLGPGDIDHRQRFLNARLTLEAVHRLGAVAVVNENDTVATEELRFGDNDRLAAMTCGLVRGDVLVLLSDVDGIHDVETSEEGSRRLLGRISSIGLDDPKLDAIAGPPVSGVGRGGMVSKVQAARLAARFGVKTVVAPGKMLGVLGALRDGQDVGTLMVPAHGTDLVGRKVWLGTSAIPVGTIHCDAGAKRAVLERGASLLPSGIQDVTGEFAEGSVVALAGGDGEVFAKGLCVYAASDIRRIAGAQSADIASILGFRILDSVIHRDSLVIL